MRTIGLTDTTLRDGLQRPELQLSGDERVRLAGLLDRAGFLSLEVGIPASGDTECELIARILEHRCTPMALWNRLREEDVRRAIACGPDIVHLSIPVSDGLLTAVLGQSRRWVRQMLMTCADLVRGNGLRLTAGFLDASRADPAFLVLLANDLWAIGAESVRLADTVGVLTPGATRSLVTRMVRETDLPIGIHPHNDLFLAKAVAVEAVHAGASFVDTTLFGIGERAGNCDSYTLAQAMDGFFATTPSAAALKTLQEEAAEMLFPGEPRMMENPVRTREDAMTKG